LQSLEDRILPTVSIDHLLVPSHVREGMTANFSAAASIGDPAAPLSYAWNFGDGTTATGIDLTNTAHGYSTPGIYVVTLTVSDPAGDSDTAVSGVTVQDLDALYVDVTPAAQTVTIGSVARWNGSYINPHGTVTDDGLEWDIDYDGLYFTADITGTLTAAYIFNSLGAHHVALRVTDQQGLSQIREAVVFVENYRGPDATAGPNLSVFEQEAVSFSGSYTDPDGIVGPEGVAWDFSWDGTFDAQATGTLNPTWQFTEPGLYDVALQVTDNHAISDISFLTVEVKNLPPYVNAGIDRNVAAADVVSFVGEYSMAGTVELANINWDFDYDGVVFEPDPSATGNLTPTHIYTTSGSYLAALRVSDSTNTTVIDTAAVTVSNRRPIVQLSADQTIDQGQFASFSAVITNSVGVTVDWDFEYDGTFDADPSAHNLLATNHQYLKAGISYAAIQAVHASGAATIRYVLVTVNNLPPSATVTHNGLIAEAGAVTFDISNVADINPDAYFDYLADWNATGDFERIPDDRRVVDPVDGSVSFQRTFDDNGLRPVVIRILDYEGGYTDYRMVVSITNAAPILVGLLPGGKIDIGCLIRYNGVSDPSHADTQAGFRYFHRVRANLFGEFLYQTGWIEDDRPEFFLPDYTYNVEYFIEAYIEDKDGAISSTISTNVVLVETGFGVAFINDSTGRVLVNGQLFLPGQHAGVEWPSTLGPNLTVTLLDSGAQYRLWTNGSFRYVGPGSGVVSVGIELHTYDLSTSPYPWATNPYGRGDIGIVVVPPGDQYDASWIGIRARGSLGSIIGPDTVGTFGAYGTHISFQGLTGSITGLDFIAGTLSANVDGNELGWLGDSSDDQVECNRGISTLFAYGVRASVLADSFFDLSDGLFAVNIGDGGTQAKLEANAATHFSTRGRVARLHTNLLGGFAQFSPESVDAVYARNVIEGGGILVADGGSLTQLALGSWAVQNIEINVELLNELLTPADYADEFWKTIPGGKIDGWDVHHTLPQGGKDKILKQRFLREKGIDIDEPKYLRGLESSVILRWTPKAGQEKGSD
jgi:PKD repeat protein